MKKNLVNLMVLFSLFTYYGKVNAQALSTSSSTFSENTDSVRFSDYFIAKTLRIDFVMAGNHSTEKVFLDRIKQEPIWAGPHKNLIDPYDLGSFRILMLDSASGKTIFTRGLCNVFQEWQGTEEALKVDRSFPQSAIMPYPLKTILFRIEKRLFENGKFARLFEMYINPKDYFIIRENPHPIPYVKFQDSGNPENKVDIAFIAEGYTQKEMSKFLADAKRIGDYFLSVKPYSEYNDRFNFYAVEAPSDESGVDVPGKNIYVNTNINSSFYTFNTDRYMTTSDAQSIYDIAASVPFDAILILVNSNTAAKRDLAGGIGRVAAPGGATVMGGVEGDDGGGGQVHHERQETVIAKEDRGLRQVHVGIVTRRQGNGLLRPIETAIMGDEQVDFAVDRTLAGNPAGAGIQEGHAALDAAQGQAAGGIGAGGVVVKNAQPGGAAIRGLEQFNRLGTGTRAQVCQGEAGGGIQELEVTTTEGGIERGPGETGIGGAVELAG